MKLILAAITDLSLRGCKIYPVLLLGPVVFP